jgi:nitrosocyanin
MVWCEGYDAGHGPELEQGHEGIMRKSGDSRRRLGGLVAGGLLLMLGLTGSVEAQETKKFTLINVLLDGTKIWLPSSLMLQQGDAVELTVVNKLDEPHGFKIEAFGVEEVVQPKAQTTVKFTATKLGSHAFVCQMHPPHIGGQILVLQK